MNILNTCQSVALLTVAVSNLINAVLLGKLSKRVKDLEQLKELDEAILKRWREGK